MSASVRSGPRRLAFVSTMPPTRCGLATFAADLVRAVRAAASPDTRCVPVALHRDPATVPDGLAIAVDEAAAYDRAAIALNARDTELICVQHEYGIYGGPDGEMLLRLLDRTTAPVVTTLHTLLDHPSANQRRVLDAIVARSSRVVVMTQRSAALMTERHGVAPGRLAVVPHGIPAITTCRRELGRRQLDADGRTVLLTFGLLSPGKGIEHAIAALPNVVRHRPDILYVVLGATHPNLVRVEGEAYRDGLTALAARLGVADHVRFLDRYVDLPELTAALAATDIYLTPYLNEAQSVSGTLAYSYGLGNAVISTPYRHAAELLAGGNGVLVPFADPGAIATAIRDLLDHPARLRSIRERARDAGRDMAWPRIGERYHDIFRAVVAAR